MPPLPGEERLVTVYADIHYYFAQPTARPVLHRFEKATYFYIYYNSTRHTSRLEVANGPGTPEQDAFNGYLEDCRVINTYKFPSLVTLVVNAAGSSSQSSGGARSPTSRDPEEWRLASADPRDNGKQKYRLHTLDIYFWTADDAAQVTTLMKKLLQPSQLDIVEADLPPVHHEQQQQQQQQHHEDVTPVVRNLENVALSDPAYQDGRTRNSQNQAQGQSSTGPAASSQSRAAAAHSPSPVSQISSVDRSDSVKPHDPAAFTPLAYNPAAPPAPEPIAHREKTPPPPDAADGTGLGAAIHDAPYRPGVPQTQSPYVPGAPGPAPNIYGHAGSPPPPGAPTYSQPGLQAAAAYSSPGRTSTSSATPSFGPTATPSYGPNAPAPAAPLTQTTSRHSTSTAAQQYAPPPKDTQVYAPGGTAATQPPETPGEQFYNSLAETQPGGRHQSLAHVQPQYADYLSSRTSPAPPLGGYSDYQYHASGQPVPGGAAQPGDIHSQVYRPTEGEHAHGHGHGGGNKGRRTSSGAGGSGGQGKPGSGVSSAFDRGADRIEKKAGGWLKKLEKKIG